LWNHDAVQHQEEYMIADHESATGSVDDCSETILFVDDEQAIHQWAARFLAKAGYRVVHAKDGREATELYAAMSSEIDVAVVDLIMPQMDGARCLTELRSINPDLKSILTTGYTPQLCRLQIEKAGATMFLPKPFGRAEVLAALRRVLGADGKSGESDGA
jgi:CheY-like chemotaxis protein